MADSHPKPVFGSPAPAAPSQTEAAPVESQSVADAQHRCRAAHPGRSCGASHLGLVGRLDLRAFYEAVKAVEGHPGQPPFDPQLMISIWVYGLSRGMSSARELSQEQLQKRGPRADAWAVVLRARYFFLAVGGRFLAGGAAACAGQPSILSLLSTVKVNMNGSFVNAVGTPSNWISVP